MPAGSAARRGAALQVRACLVVALAAAAPGVGLGGTPPFTDAEVEYLCGARFVDVHTHCSEALDEPVPPRAAVEYFLTHEPEEYCDLEGWDATFAAHRPVAAMALTQAYWMLGAYEVYPDPVREWVTDRIDEGYGASLGTRPPLFLFGSLDCIHDARFSDADWVERCKEDVDRWLTRGAKGLKDHMGKQRGVEIELFLGMWNRFNGFCSPERPQPNRKCMEEPTVRYPALEPKWRDVVAYIVEEKGVPLVTHLTSYPDPETRCWDPLSGGLLSCGEATRDHLFDFAGWAEAELGEEARRRIVVAHMGFLESPEDWDLLRDLVATGISVDGARQPSAFGSSPDRACQVRELIADLRGRLLFGTDSRTGPGCVPETYAAWDHLLFGDFGDARSFPDACNPQGPIHPLDLKSETVEGCPHAVPAGTADDLLGDELMRRYGVECALVRPGRR